MIEAEVTVDIRAILSVNFQEDRIDGMDGMDFEIGSIVLRGAETLNDKERRILYTRAKDIVMDQFDLDELV